MSHTTRNTLAILVCALTLGVLAWVALAGNPSGPPVSGEPTRSPGAEPTVVPRVAGPIAPPDGRTVAGSSAAIGDPDSERVEQPATPGGFVGRLVVPEDVVAATDLFELDLRGARAIALRKATDSDDRLDTRFVATDVPPGEYACVVRRGPGDSADSERSRNWEVVEPVDVAIHAGRVAAVAVTVRPLAQRHDTALVTLVGNVFLDGRPAAGMLVDVLPSSDAMTDVDDRGYFELTDVPTGLRVLHVRSDQLQNGFSDLHYVHERRVLDLQPGEQVPLQFHLQTATVHGTVRDAGGRAVADVPVALFSDRIRLDDAPPEHRPRVATKTDGRGYFEFDGLPLGTFDLIATRGGAAAPRATITPTPEATSVQHDLQLEPLVQIAARLDLQSLTPDKVVRVVFDGPIRRASRARLSAELDPVALLPGVYAVIVETRTGAHEGRPLIVRAGGTPNVVIRIE